MNKNIRKSYILNLLSIVALFAIFQIIIEGGLISTYFKGIILVIGINIILATSLNLTTGILGQLTLGHAGFMSVGAYTAAIFTKATVDILPEWLCLFLGILLGALLAGLIGLAVGIPALRLKGDYLAIITLGFGEIIRVIIENMTITGGAQGLKSIPRITNFTFVYLFMVMTVALLFTFGRSRHGRAVISIREDDIASESCGINIVFYRTLAFTMSAALAGVAGALYAHYIGILSATNFSFLKSVEIVVMVVLGGMGSITGSIVAAIVLTALPEALRGLADYRMLIYSIVLILVMIFKPTGLLDTYEFSLIKFVNDMKFKIKNFPKGNLDKDGE